MSAGILEHVNVTVSDIERTTQNLCDFFGWKVRWSGPSIHGGHTAHVGSEFSYLALYSRDTKTPQAERSYDLINGLNHIAIVVEDLEAVEAKILGAGYKTHNHGNYEPGRRFYFNDHDEIEFEVINYAKEKSA
ncbi:MAG: glyoxalase [Robiginitomaculum sp.]|nr:MAG: glyoxalase [Robiginitomaculum sp.]